ncbi:hypothetical protein [Amphritea balenae]|uniref:Lipoprotein n=1 Tax=Amphritea balenae TaxID=452629 RepID=A0A3P1SNJ5_9GAMM|nr:hypothetical protein [Amphritea balenae]RRC98630.1 hypothetical protein EHS89_13545 [Amphritea balenae]GGK66107.1 hypothetical protein GCM10007941_15380 [Amphritea balenae]
MIRILTLALSGLLLTGCISNPLSQEPIDTSFYMIDLKRNIICLGNSKNCEDMSPLYHNPIKANRIGSLYNQAVTGESTRSALLKMIIRPDNKTYSGEKLSDDGRFYTIPLTEKTRQLFLIIKDASHNKNQSF